MRAEVIEVFSDGRPRQRRAFSAAFKRRLVGMTLEPDASVAGVALAHGLNTNLLFKWRREQATAGKRGAKVSARVPALLPVSVSPQVIEPVRAAVIDERRDGLIEVAVAGHTLRLHGRVDLHTVDALLRMLERNR